MAARAGATDRRSNRRGIGLFVIDLDTSKHPEATDWLESNAPYLPETRQHRTKSGGLHLFFKHRDGLRNSAGKLAPGVDTRGDGGYVIWWPSCVPSDHKFRVAADLPEWIVDALTPKPIPYQPRPSIAVNYGATIRGILRTVTNAPPGNAMPSCIGRLVVLANSLPRIESQKIRQSTC